MKSHQQSTQYLLSVTANLDAVLLFHRHSSKQSDLVQKQLTGALAVLLKRGWAEESPAERHVFFSEVEHTVAASSNAAARRTGIQILEVSTVGKLLMYGLLMLECTQPYAM